MSSVASILTSTPAVLSPQNGGGGGGGGGVTSIVAGTNVTISPVGGTGAVTINSSGAGVSSVTSDPVTSGITCTDTAGAVVLTNTGLVKNITSFAFDSGVLNLGTTVGVTLGDLTGPVGTFIAPRSGLHILTALFETVVSNATGTTWNNPTVLLIRMEGPAPSVAVTDIYIAGIGNIPSSPSANLNNMNTNSLCCYLAAGTYTIIWYCDNNNPVSALGPGIVSHQLNLQVTIAALC